MPAEPSANGPAWLDRGVSLYRATFRSGLWRYYAASAPFGLVLLWATARASALRADVPLCGLLLAAAYAARSLGSGVYTRHLWRRLGGATAAADGSRAGRATLALREIGGQGVLFALWLAGAAALGLGVPLAYAASQYLALDPERRLRPALAAAAARYPGHWALLLLAVLLGAVAFANLALVLILVPMAVQGLFSFTGAAASGNLAALLTNSNVYWTAAALAAYLALDPLFKCASVAAHFERRARRSGADLAAALARIAAAALLLAVGAGAAQVPPPQWSRAIQQELRQPPYAWQRPVASRTDAWLARAAHWALAPVRVAGRVLGRWLARFLQWLFPSGAPGPAGTHHGPGVGWLHFTYLLAALCLLALLVVLWRRRHLPPMPVPGPPPGPLLEVDVRTASAADQAPDAWFAVADRLLAGGELRLAVRAAYLGGLAALGRRRLLTIRRDRTDRDYLDEFARRAPLDPAAPGVERVRDGLRAFQAAWYGGRVPDPDRVAAYLADQRSLNA